jgi:glycosyltransferase involved in cell wall biosynthesis
VVNGHNGCVCDPEPEALADAMRQLSADRRRAAAFGDAGHEVAQRITWDGVIETLVG